MYLVYKVQVSNSKNRTSLPLLLITFNKQAKFLLKKKHMELLMYFLDLDFLFEEGSRLM